MDPQTCQLIAKFRPQWYWGIRRKTGLNEEHHGQSWGRGKATGIQEAGAGMGQYCAEPGFEPVCVCWSLVKAEGCQFEDGFDDAPQGSRWDTPEGETTHHVEDVCERVGVMQ